MNMSPFYAALPPKRDKVIAGLRCFTAGLPVRLIMAGKAIAEDTDAEGAAQQFLCDFAAEAGAFVHFVRESEAVPAHMGDGAPVDGTALPLDVLFEVYAFALQSSASVPLPSAPPAPTC